ncbi:MAG: hypothetical protein KJN62_01480 [Deltaproteobacteria bacterium]|nr:hypothetical protein [Deltaproteobacteria bacterium]
MKRSSILTHGGLPLSEAWHWNVETSRQLGDIVVRLMSGSEQRIRQAYIDYYEMKRHFITNEFDLKIEELDRYRIEHDFITVTAMIEDARRQFVTDGDLINTEKDRVIIAQKEPQKTAVEIMKQWEKDEKVEQMSLL